MRRRRAEKIPGGLAAGKNPKDFDPKQIAKGIKVEVEHTKDKDLAREIAMDHLTENPKYYDYLDAMEKKMDKKGTTLRKSMKRVATRYFRQKHAAGVKEAREKIRQGKNRGVCAAIGWFNDAKSTRYMVVKLAQDQGTELVLDYGSDIQIDPRIRRGDQVSLTLTGPYTAHWKRTATT